MTLMKFSFALRPGVAVVDLLLRAFEVPGLGLLVDVGPGGERDRDDDGGGDQDGAALDEVLLRGREAGVEEVHAPAGRRRGRTRRGRSPRPSRAVAAERRRRRRHPPLRTARATGAGRVLICTPRASPSDWTVDGVRGRIRPRRSAPGGRPALPASCRRRRRCRQPLEERSRPWRPLLPPARSRCGRTRAVERRSSPTSIVGGALAAPRCRRTRGWAPFWTVNSAPDGPDRQDHGLAVNPAVAAPTPRPTG